MTDELLQRYPWLSVLNTVEEYIEPDYYNKLLKAYSFGDKDDLSILKDYITNISTRETSSVIELCCGSGRVSDLVTRALPNANFTFVDLSARMLSYTKDKYPEKPTYQYIQDDAVDVLAKLGDTMYDFMYSLWGFSHSVHQHIHDDGLENTKKKLASNIKTFIANNLAAGGKAFIIHFDSMSDEQRILMRQWQRVYPTFSDISVQSPSKMILDEILSDLDNRNEIYLTRAHLKGDPIKYSDEDEVLEIFMNFHLETYFNDTDMASLVLNDIKKQIKPYRNADGSYSITPGCYVYSLEKATD